MSRKILERNLLLLENSINRLDFAVKTLIDSGAGKEAAAMIGPKPEAKAYVATMRRLFSKMNGQTITNKGHMLAEMEDAYYGLRVHRNNIHVAQVRATSEVALALFEISDEEMHEAQNRAIARAVEPRHGWNGILGD